MPGAQSGSLCTSSAGEADDMLPLLISSSEDDAGGIQVKVGFTDGLGLESSPRSAMTSAVTRR